MRPSGRRGCSLRRRLLMSIRLTILCICLGLVSPAVAFAEPINPSFLVTQNDLEDGVVSWGVEVFGNAKGAGTVSGFVEIFVFGSSVDKGNFSGNTFGDDFFYSASASGKFTTTSENPVAFDVGIGSDSCPNPMVACGSADFSPSFP